MVIENEAEASRGDVQQNELPDKHPITYGGDSTSSKRVPQPEETVKRQFSYSNSTSKRSVVEDLKNIIARGGDPAELHRYVTQWSLTDIISAAYAETIIAGMNSDE